MRKIQTVADVKETFRLIKKPDTRVAMARAMLRHGNLTDDARAYIDREYSSLIASQYGADA